MAASNLNLGKASGGVLNIQPADGTTTTSLVLPAINGTVVAADSNGNVGIGVTPSASGSTTHGVQTEYNYMGSRGGSGQIMYNAVPSGNSTDKYIVSSLQSLAYEQNSTGQHIWKIAPSGTAGNAITWTNAMTLYNSGNLLLQSGTGGLGYGTGAGGTVTQLTSKGTAVTLNKPTGKIIMNTAALASGARVEFILSSNLLSANDLLAVNIVGGIGNALNYRIESVNTTTGGAYIRLTNLSGESLSEAVEVAFAIIRGAVA
jgi:hypothetical protein